MNIIINKLKEKIEYIFENKEQNFDRTETLEMLDNVIDLLNSGQIRIAEKKDDNDEWIVNSWIKKAILLCFKYKDLEKDEAFDSFDKLGLLKYDYNSKRYRKIPGSIIRDGVYIGNKAVIMPSYINIGSYIDDNTMIDINSVIGSCAQIGKNCHISALSCIGGVLEPLVANPVIIEDNCFIGAHSSVLEGVIIKEGSIIASGVTISSSTKIIDRKTKEIYFGIVPRGSVVVSGSYPSDGINISCAVIVKTIDSKSNNKTNINELLRPDN